MRISDWSSDVCSSDLSTTSSCERAAESGEALLGAAAALQAVIDETIEPRHRARPAVVRLDPRPAGVRQRPPRGTVVHQPEQLFRIVLGGAGNQDVLAGQDRKSTRLNSSHECAYRMPSSA